MLISSADMFSLLSTADTGLESQDALGYLYFAQIPTVGIWAAAVVEITHGQDLSFCFHYLLSL